MSRSKNGRSKSRKVEPSVTGKAFLHDRDGNVKDSIETANVTTAQSPVSSHQSRLDVSTQDSLNLDYHFTLCTQTQDGGVEVTWDWHSPGRKAVGINGNDVRTHEAPSGSTPKRAPIVHKKRISNSPLMYKPLKRKLIKQENTGDIDKFKAELIALSEKIKNAKEDDKCSADVLDGIVKDDNTREKVFGGLGYDDGARDDDKVQKTSTGDKLEKNNQFDELFDDSLNDTMIKCSQEIEERLNIAPVNLKEMNNVDSSSRQEGKNFLVRNKSYCRSMNMNESSINRNSSMIKHKANIQAITNSSANTTKFTMKKHKSDVIISKTVMQTLTHSTSTKTAEISNIMSDIRQQQSKSQSEKSESKVENTDDLFIPDDSFDEFLATCDEDFSHSDINFTSTSTERCGTICDSGHSESPTTSISSSSTMPSKASSTPMKNKNNVPQGNIVKTNAIPNSNSNNPTAQSTLGPIASSSVKRDWKFFKSKSHSDSSFTNDNSKVANSSSKSPNQTGLTRMVTGSFVSTTHQIPPMHRTTSCLDTNTITGKSTQKINAYNNQMYHVNRCAAKEDGDGTNNYSSGSKDVASSIQSLQLCGPEEIARKRMEAKMKLEAKKKREKMRNNSVNGSNSALLQTRNKR